MDINQSLQVIIDQQLSEGKKYEDIVSEIESAARKLKRLSDTQFIAENPLSPWEQAAVRSIAPNSTTGLISVIKSYRSRVKNADLTRAKLAVDTYRDFLNDKVTKRSFTPTTPNQFKTSYG